MKEKKPINIAVGAQIQKAREKAGLTQSKFAEMIDLGEKNVSAIERGAVGISLPTMKKICQVLAVSSDTLLFGPAADNDMKDLISRLERLTPEQFEIASDIFNKLLEAFAIADE